MIVVGLLLFIIIVGISSVVNRRRRYFADLELYQRRKESIDAIAQLHKVLPR